MLERVLVLPSLFYFKNPKRHLFVNIDLIAAAMLDSPPSQCAFRPTLGDQMERQADKGNPWKTHKTICCK